LHCWNVWRGLTSSSGILWSDYQREFVECCGKRLSGTCIDPEFVVASPQILDEGMSSDHDARGPVPFEAMHGAESGLKAAMVGFDSVVCVLVGVVESSREEFCDHADERMGPVSRDFGRLAMCGDQ